MRITHLTAHLGGGVGNALSVLCAETAAHAPAIERQIVCLEPPVKQQFYRRILESGTSIIIAPTVAQLAELVKQSDIVQLEWWNHPGTIQALCRLGEMRARLVVWSHVSGLFNPIVPPRLINEALVFVSSTSISPDRNPRADLPVASAPIEFISSAGGFESFPPLPRRDDAEAICRFGYIGTTNLTKLFPDFVDFLAGVPEPSFCTRIIGDEVGRNLLEAQSLAAGRPTLLEFLGYREDILGELSQLDVLLYLLNPRHYGTAEIALLEAMAMGVVPVVLNNPVERGIVENGATGIVVNSKAEFVAAVKALRESKTLRQNLSLNAASFVRGAYTSSRMLTRFQDVYAKVSGFPKKEYRFTEIFGAQPFEWFLSCQRDTSLFNTISAERITSDPFLRAELQEVNKGSISQFSSYFPADETLRGWADTIRRLL